MSWNRSTIITCHFCNKDLTQSTPIAASRPQLTISKLTTAYLFENSRASCVEDSNGFTTATDLGQVPLDDFLSLYADFASLHQRHHLMLGSVFRAGTPSVAESSAHNDRFFQVLNQWPQGLETSLAEYSQGRTLFQNRSCAPFALMGPWIVFQGKRYANGPLAFVRKAFTTYVEHRWTPSSSTYDPTRVSGRRKLPPPKGLDESELEEFLGLNGRHLRMARDWQFLPIVDTSVDDFRYTREQCVRAMSFFDSLVTPEVAALCLGISLRNLSRLFNSRVHTLTLPPTIGDELRGLKSHDRYVHVDELQEIYGIFVSKVSASVQDETYLGMDNILTGDNTARGLNLALLVALVEQGRVRVSRQSDRIGLRSFSFVLSDIKRALNEEKEQEFPGTSSVKDAAIQLGIYPDAVYRVIEAKLLPATVMKGKQYRISQGALDEFQAAYSFVRPLAAQLKCTPNNLAEKIMSAGVRPVSGPGIDNGLVFLFRKTELAALDLQAVASQKHYPTRTGRRPKTECEGSMKEGLLTTAQAAAMIRVPERTLLTKLVDRGLLQPQMIGEGGARRSFFRRDDVEGYLNNFRRNAALITVRRAAAWLNEPLREIRLRWVRLSMLTPHDSGLNQYFVVEDVKKVIEKKKDWVSTREACAILNVDRHQVGNWVRLGILKPVSGPQIDGCGVLQFARGEVENLRDAWRPASA